jgi:hypothetical protein
MLTLLEITRPFLSALQTWNKFFAKSIAITLQSNMYGLHGKSLVTYYVTLEV